MVDRTGDFGVRIHSFLQPHRGSIRLFFGKLVEAVQTITNLQPMVRHTLQSITSVISSGNDIAHQSGRYKKYGLFLSKGKTELLARSVGDSTAVTLLIAHKHSLTCSYSPDPRERNSTPHHRKVQTRRWNGRQPTGLLG